MTSPRDKLLDLIDPGDRGADGIDLGDVISVTPTGASVPQTLANLLANALSPKRTFAILGDSIEDMSASVGSNRTKNIRGYANWVGFLSGQRVWMPEEWDFGVSGDTSTQVLARVGDVIAAKPGFCIVGPGTNDTALTAAQTIANLDSMYTALLLSGIRVIARLILPRNDGGSTATTRARNKAVNEWIKSQRFTRSNFYVLDATALYGMPLTGDTRAGITADMLHPNGNGALIIGGVGADIFKALIPDAPVSLWDNTDAWSTDNPSGNLVVNGLMTGTGGTVSAWATGSLASNWKCGTTTPSTGITVAFSKEARADGSEWQVITLGGSHTSASPPSFEILSGAGFLSAALASIGSAGFIEGFAEIQVDAGATGLSGIPVQALASGGTDGFRVAADLYGGPSSMPSRAFSGVARTPRLPLLSATYAAASFSMQPIASVGAVPVPVSLTMRIGGVSFRKALLAP